MKVFFWQNMPAHIQLGALRSFAEIWVDDVHAIWRADIPPNRKALGCGREAGGKLQERILPAGRKQWRPEVERIVEQETDAWHIFSGIGGYPPITFAAGLLAECPSARLVMIVEPGSAWGWRGRLRPFWHRWIYRRYVRRIDAILAMGTEGREYFVSVGFAPEHVFSYIYQSPFGRFTEILGVALPVRFVFVGQLHRRKGVDLLVDALSAIPSDRWMLDIYGSGPMGSWLQAEIEARNLSANIRLHGSIQADKVVQTIHKYDVACVPSRHDGWGVVTNEAIQAGVPVVVSNRASSCGLVETSGAGIVYDPGVAHALENSLRRIAENPRQVMEWKAEAVRFSSRIQPDSVAAYLKIVLEYVGEGCNASPKAPWDKEVNVD